jgi:hypothetical protein
MGKLKVVLSVLALLVMAAGGVTGFGPWEVPGPVSELLVAAGGILAWLGVSPASVPLPVARVCSALSVGLATFVASHAATWGDGQRHAEVVALGFLAALLGVVGRGLGPAPAAPPKP